MAYIFQSWLTAQVLTSAAQSQVEVNIRDHVHGVSGVTSIPYRTLIPAANAYVRDEFIGGVYGKLNGRLTGELGWIPYDIYGVVVQLIPAIAGHPGIASIPTGANINNYNYLQLSSVQIIPADSFDTIFIFKVPSVTSVTFVMGLYGSNADGLYLEKLSTDSNWFAVSRVSSTQTRADMGVAAIDTWYKVRIRRVDGATIGYTINSGSEVTATTNIPTAGLHPYIYVVTTEAVNKYIHIDYFDMIFTGLSR
mgnify:CR=1 FL=1